MADVTTALAATDKIVTIIKAVHDYIDGKNKPKIGDFQSKLAASRVIQAAVASSGAGAPGGVPAGGAPAGGPPGPPGGVPAGGAPAGGPPGGAGAGGAGAGAGAGPPVAGAATGATPVPTLQILPMQRVLRSLTRLDLSTYANTLAAPGTTAAAFARTQVQEAFTLLMSEVNTISWPGKPNAAFITAITNPALVAIGARAAADMLKGLYLATPRESASYALRCLLYVDCITDIYSDSTQTPKDMYLKIAALAHDLEIDEPPMPAVYAVATKAFNDLAAALGSPATMPQTILDQAGDAATSNDITTIFQKAMEQALQAYQCAVLAWNATRRDPTDNLTDYGGKPDVRAIVLGDPITGAVGNPTGIAKHLIRDIPIAKYVTNKPPPPENIPANQLYPAAYNDLYKTTFAKFCRSGAITNVTGAPGGPPARAVLLETEIVRSLNEDWTAPRLLPELLDANAIDACVTYGGRQPPPQISPLNGGALHALLTTPVPVNKSTVHAVHDLLAPKIANAINLLYRNITISQSILNLTANGMIGGGSYEAVQEQQEQEQEQEQEQQEQQEQEQEKQEQEQEQEGGKKKSKLRRSKKKSKRSE